MPAKQVTILDLGGGDEGHRAQYIAFLGTLFSVDRTRFAWPVLFDAKPVMVPLIEDSLSLYALTCVVRALQGKRTAGFLFRPRPAIEARSGRYRVKRLVLRVLRLLPWVTTLTILPFSVEPRFAEIADDWIYDPQVWDLQGAVDQGMVHHGGVMARELALRAKGRAICCALGRQDQAKGFDQFAQCYIANPSLREAVLFAYGGKVDPALAALAAAFGAVGGFGLDRFIGDEELLSLYASADFVWCAYAPDYDQASGILGRAMQLGIPVVVRKGSLIERLCQIESLPHIPVGPETDLSGLAKMPARESRAKAADRAHRHAAESLLRLGRAMGISLG